MTVRTRKPTKPTLCDPALPPEPFGTLWLKAERLKTLHARRDPTLLPGPTGCGKTTLIEWLVSHLSLPRHEVIIGSREMLPADLVGRWHLGASGSDWRDNALTRAVVEGRILYFDEIGEVGEDVQKVLYPLLDHRRELIINSKEGIKIKAHPNFWFVGSYNPPARLPAHFRQRCRFLPITYLPADEEQALLTARVGIKAEDSEFLVRLAEITRTRLQGTVSEGASTRLLLAAAEDLKAGLGREEVARDSVLLPLTDDDQARITAMQAFQSAGLFSIDEVRRLQLADRGRVELPMTDDDFFDTTDDEAEDRPSF